MNTHQIDAVVARKRLVHPELAEALTWQGFLAVCAREWVSVVRMPLPAPATLVNFDGDWTIGINSAQASPRHDTADGAHELAHLWIHVDEMPQGRAVCFNHGYGSNPDPREDEADYLASALLYGPKYFPTLSSVAVMSRMKREPAQLVDLSPITIKGEGDFALGVKGTGELAAQAALYGLCDGQTPRDRKVAATLIPESDNPADTKAIRVEIDGRRVGYLSRDHARLFRRWYGRRSAMVPAQILGGLDRGLGKRLGSFVVRLDLKL